MKNFVIFFFLVIIQAQSLASSCPDGSEPEKKISADGTYFIYECAGSSSNSQSGAKSNSSHKLDDPKNWPSGIKHAKWASANAILYFDDAKKPERLYINSSDRPPHNVAYEGNTESPTSFYGFWPKGAYSKNSPYFGEFRERFYYEQEIDEIVDGNDHAQRGFDEENKEVFSFHLQKFHNGDRESLETLKSLMFEWVNGPYWEAMIPDRQLACTTCSNEFPIWEGYNFSILGELWNTLIPMLEVHITLIREDAYSEEEYILAHQWLEKRVWLAEQGPDEGQLYSGFRWIPDPGPPNHHTVRKTLGYLMWGVADQNSEYYTAGVRGFEQYYNVLRSDGSITTEHFYDKACQTGFGDHGCRNGLSLGNETGKFYALAAIVMHNQGMNIREKFPKIEKNIEWTTKVAVNPSTAMKWIGDVFVEENRGSVGNTFSKEGIVMDWARNWSPLRKNLSHIYLWDNIFKTNYSDNLKGVFVVDQGKYQEETYNHIVRRAFDFGIADTGLITFNSNEVQKGMSLDSAIYLESKSKSTDEKAEQIEKIEADSSFDGEYTFRLFRSSEEGNMKLGNGTFEIKNGVLAYIDDNKSNLSTGSKDFYKTLNGKIDKDGNVIGSIEMSILYGKDRSEIYNLFGPIKKILGESPDEDFFTIYLSVKKAKERKLKVSTPSNQAKTSGNNPTVTNVVEVIQGDKLIVDIVGSSEISGSNINLYIKDIDAPDIVKSCKKEIEFGLRVKDIVSEIISNATSIELVNYRKTAKGVISQLIIDGKDLGEDLIAKEYASDESGYWKAYICSAKKAYMAGNMHMTSGKHEKAIFWYERALEMDPDNNNAPGATYRLSLAYKYLGNTEKAKDSLKMSALLGFMEAELDLGENYWNGWDGFEKDLSEGKYWLKKAHENGSQDAEKICDCNL